MNDKVGKGCGAIVGAMLLAMLVAFAARWGWYAAGRLLGL